MENVVKEDVLQALTEFGRKGDSPIPRLLEDYLRFVANTGDTVFPWTVIKALVRRKIEQVLCDFLVISSPDSVPPSPNVDPFKYAVMREKILEALEYFTQAPFTIQRLCEVMVDPKKYYKRIDKLMRAIEKNLLVTTTVDPRRPGSPNGEADGPQASGVANGYEERANGHHPGSVRGTTGIPEGAQLSPADRASTGSVLDEEEPMDITGPVAPQPHAVLDCPAEAMEGCEDECGEDIDVDQDNSQPVDAPTHATAAAAAGSSAGATASPPDGSNAGHQLDSSSPISSGVPAAGVGGTGAQETGTVQAAGGAANVSIGGSSQENLLHIQQQIREQQQQQQMMAMTSFEGASAVAGGSKGEGSGTGSGIVGSEPGTTASSAGGPGAGASQPSRGATLNEDSCSDVEAEGESEHDMMLLMMRDAREESTQDNELEQQVPQFGSCESGESGGLSPVQFQSVSSQSSQDTKRDALHSIQSTTASTTAATTSPVASVLSHGSRANLGVDQSSLVESSQQTADGDCNAAGECAGQNHNNEARTTQDGQDSSRLGGGGSEAVTPSGGDQTSEGKDGKSYRGPSGGAFSRPEDTQEASIGQSSEQNQTVASASAAISRATGPSRQDAEASEQAELDTTGSPSNNEAVAKE